MPVIKPVVELMLSPGGNPVAPYVRPLPSELLAAICRLTVAPSVLVCAPGLVTTGVAAIRYVTMAAAHWLLTIVPLALYWAATLTIWYSGLMVAFEFGWPPDVPADPIAV